MVVSGVMSACVPGVILLVKLCDAGNHAGLGLGKGQL